MAQPKRPGEGMPELPRTPEPAPETPGRIGAPPGPDVPELPRPAPDVGEPPDRPEAPADPNQPGR